MALNNGETASNILLTNNAVLILIDLQRAIDHPSWGPRNNSYAETHIAALLSEWRRCQWPVIHIRHASTKADSTYRRGQIGYEFKPEATPIDGEMIIVKQVNNAFIGTGLEQQLRAKSHSTLVVAGVCTNNSVEATVRMAGNLGFQTYLVEDACFTFAKQDWHGRLRSAEEVHAMSLANLDGEYCTVVNSAAINSYFRAAI